MNINKIVKLLTSKESITCAYKIVSLAVYLSNINKIQIVGMKLQLTDDLACIFNNDKKYRTIPARLPFGDGGFVVKTNHDVHT